uniref:CD99 antigen-like protein 2 n=1 Tax=Mus musculus TaxID=10090 RepID=I7HJQ8_MOUSE
MVARLTAFLVCLVFSLATLVQRGYGDTDGFNLEDALKETSSVKQLDGFDLEDALDDRNDLDGPKKPSAGEAGGWSDKDLEDIVEGGGYKPDKNKGGGGYGSNDDPGSGISTETGTIAGVASALAMALIGAVSSYISYQQKKFCFSIQQGLNADYVKGENLEAVVCEEPQVTYSKQETQSAEPPPPEPPRI